MITLAIFLVWAMHQIDFMQAYAQAPIVCDKYMEMSPRIETKHGDSKDYILKLLMNLAVYGTSKWLINYAKLDFNNPSFRSAYFIVMISFL